MGATVTVTAKSVYVNPSAATAKYTAAHTLTVTAATSEANPPPNRLRRRAALGIGATSACRPSGLLPC